MARPIGVIIPSSSIAVIAPKASNVFNELIINFSCGGEINSSNKILIFLTVLASSIRIISRILPVISVFSIDGTGYFIKLP